MKRSLFIAILLSLFIFDNYCQKINITGESPNYYLKVDEVLTNGVRISETLNNHLQNFMPGDKVLLIQHSGVTIDSGVNFKIIEARSKKSLQNTGSFEILQVDEVIKGADTTIYFTDNLSYDYDNGEKIQLVRLIEGETVNVTGTLYPKSWDGVVGGIIGIIGIDTVNLSDNSSIDVSGKGFRGGAIPSEIYQNGKCRYGTSSSVDTLYFHPSETGRSGNKGEGIITSGWPYTKGTGFNINGGGAGNGLFAGGGGGSNYRLGGDGGKQSAYCTSLYSVSGGWGGYSCWEIYANSTKPKVIMGGGGGSGTRMSGSTPSVGGNGGGIIFIITTTLRSSATASLKANGENATPSSTAGSGAGGGAGGTILLDATEISGPLFNIKIRGGNGTYTSTAPPNCNGAGGSGSGGVFWHSGSSFPAVSVDSTNGTPGSTAGGATYAEQIGRPGLFGTKLKRLIMPLSGFLFNSIKGVDTICAGQIPDMLKGTQPKGGNGSYSYTWQQSNNNINWSSAQGSHTLRTFQPVALTATTWYRRIITSNNSITGEIIRDTSRVLKIFVYNSIANNTLLGTDTICYNVDAKPLKSNGTLTGGNNIYTFSWQRSTNQINWFNIGTLSEYDPGRLTITTDYRRIVHSTKYCHDTSEVLTVTVLPSIIHNDFSFTDTSICQYTSPGTIKIGSPAGGDGLYEYLWQNKTISGSWTSIPQTHDSLNYTPNHLNATISYRRIVYSGNDNACSDTSNARNVIIKPEITNNNIAGSEIKYACYNSSVLLSGSNPSDGFGSGTYSYLWQQSSDKISWENTGISTKDYQNNNYIAKKYFRRIVYSTPQYKQCKDTSNFVEVKINPLPSGNVLDYDDTICASSPLYVKFNVSGNKPFDVSIRGEEAGTNLKNGINGPIDSILFTPHITQTYIINSIADDSGCVADIAGYIAVNPAKVYEVPVAKAGIDSAVCSDFYILHAIKTKPEFAGYWSANGVTFENPENETTKVTANSFGKKELTWTESNWNCVDADDVEITFFEQPQVSDAGPDEELDFKYTTQLNAVPANIGSGKWSFKTGSGEFSDNSLPQAIVSELSGNSTLYWTVSNGKCLSIVDSMNITIIPLKIPKAFTPDGNDKNQYFDFRHVNAEKISLKVYNSVGILVYESDNYGEELWEGLNKNGEELPEGTYYYIANIKVAGRAKEIQFKSFVEILR